MKFLTTLFDEHDHICLSPDAKGTVVHPWQNAASLPWVRMFSINPLHPSRDLNPTREFHAVQRPRRADGNVVSFRNFLVEMDTLELPAQLELVDKCGLPYATCTYSGGKSYHLIVSLLVPCTNETQYRQLARQIYEAIDRVAGQPVVDTNNKNPSRLSRFPGAIRKETGKEQSLLSVRRRIDLETLKQWISDHGVSETKVLPIRTRNASRDKKPSIRSTTDFFLRVGAARGQRHTQLFRASCDLAECDYSFEEMIAMLEPARRKLIGPDFSDAEFETTTSAAFERVQNRKRSRG